jgi:hypothetical protein
MSFDTLTWVVLHGLCAALFFFLLNLYILKTELQSAVFWAVALGVMAAGLAYQQSRRSGP